MNTLKMILRPLYSPLTNWYILTFKSPKRYARLFSEIKRVKAISILEIGTWNGRRAIKMIETAKLHIGSEVSYVGFDLFEDLTEEQYIAEISKRPPTLMEVQERLEATGADITLIKGNTLHTLPEFIAGSKPFDFIFIDGGHDVETVQSDWNACKELMHKNTVVIFDDYWHNRPEDCAGPVVSNIDTSIYDVEILPEIDKFNNPDFGRLEISFVKVTRKK